ncbi:MAG: energy-coupling factor transporter ATPase, partial [Firmicutes bacterium]|nr:energy-coupling factor transporter ATPase [Bacillota bacterium]
HVYSKGLPDESVALDDVSFTIEDGSFTGIIGHTGSGKSTLLQHLNGLLKPDSGHIFVGDTDITEKGSNLLAIRRKVGLVFQYPEYQLFEETVAMDVAFGPKNLGLSDEEVRARTEEALELVGLDAAEFGGKSPFELSGGQKRRVAIAGVVAMRPEVLILDEPTAGLDPKTHKDVLGMINDIHEKQHNITILVSHNMSDVAAMCDHVLVINKGKLVMDGTPEEVFGRADELNEMGLSAPPAAEFLRRLKASGVPIGRIPLDVAGAADEIIKVLGR